jgi:hypothetical protein
MQRKGDLIFWSINELETTKDALIDLGFDRFVPRNDYKSALIKAIKKITRGDDKLYRRFGDAGDEVKFAVFNEVVSGDELNLDRELGLVLNKKSGVISPVRAEDTDSRLYALIQEEFRRAAKTIDSNQFRQLVLRIVRQEGWGVAMRDGGGIYFVDARFDKMLERLQSLFTAFQASATLHRVPIFDNAGTHEALSTAISEDIAGDIASLVADIDKRFKDGSITKRQLEGDMARAADIVEKYKIHSENLRARAGAINAKLHNVMTTLREVQDRVERGIVEPSDFMKSLESL